MISAHRKHYFFSCDIKKLKKDLQMNPFKCIPYLTLHLSFCLASKNIQTNMGLIKLICNILLMF